MAIPRIEKSTEGEPGPGERQLSGDGFREYWDREWDGRHDYFRTHRERFLRSWGFIEGLDLRAKTVLELGGIGPLGGYLRDHLEARVLVSETDLRDALDFEDGLFDLVICTEVIEHIKDRESSKIEDLERFNYSGILSMLREFRRTLRPDGVLFITTPNASSWVQLLKWVLKAPLLMDPSHVRELTVDDLVEKCALAGLEPRRIELHDTWQIEGSEPFEKLRKLVEQTPDIDSEMREQNILALFEPAASGST